MAGEDPEYSAWVRLQPCANCRRPPPSEQHHRSGAGMALRAHDHESMPLCRECHHERLGQLSKEERRDLEFEWAFRSLRRYASLESGRMIFLKKDDGWPLRMGYPHDAGPMKEASEGEF